jgi:hypothetical protein
MRRGQQGLTLIGFIMVLIVLMIFGYFIMLIVPMYNEYFQIKKALVGVVKEPGIATADQYTIQDKISRHFEVGYVSSIQPKDIKVKRDQQGLSLTADYEVRKQLFSSPLYLLGHFVDTESTNPGNAKAGAEDK